MCVCVLSLLALQFSKKSSKDRDEALTSSNTVPQAKMQAMKEEMLKKEAMLKKVREGIDN